MDRTILTVRYEPLFANQHAEAGWFKLIVNNITDEIAAVLLITGGIIVAFSKVREEDEYISEIRQRSLIWAFYVHYALLLLCVLLVYEWTFYMVMVVSMFTPLMFFMVSFHIGMYRMRKFGTA